MASKPKAEPSVPAQNRNGLPPFPASSNASRLKVVVRGAVQGVGFRPFVFRLAEEMRLSGWVNNSAQGVFLEVEGPKPDLERFLLRLEAEKPPRSFIQSLEASWLDTVGYPGFEIRQSQAGGSKTALVLPDIATCPDCLRDIFEPGNRRFGYPFTNCTNCGPRFSIIESLPYDRANTSMKSFVMCPQCQAEYDDPRDRRFHAQPNACPICGPHLELWDREAHKPGKDALELAAAAIRAGSIVAVKGLGGFHLMVAANDEEAVRRLRERKHREEKPFAVMFPSLESVRAVCEVSPLEERLLRSPESPIVLLRRLHAPRSTLHAPPLSLSLAPNNPYLGVLLPYTPLHHLLLSQLGFPVVATSGNLSDEPICIDPQEALSRLGGIADLFLVHNRPIVRHVDDSVVRVMLGREMVLRRARGYAPLPVTLPDAKRPMRSVLAVGAHLKNAIALSVGPQAFLSQHIGDLESDQAYEAFRHVITDFESLYESRPSVIAADAHPDYLSTKFAREQSLPASVYSPQSVRLVSVQHHLAHVLSCMAENELPAPVLGVSWDGTGYGLDGTVWGGEFFLIQDSTWERVAHLRPFRLPGGDKAVREPRRVALGLLFEHFGEAVFAKQDLAPLRAFSPAELAGIRTMLGRRVNSPLTSSIGRLFDAVASLLGLRQQVRFEGQAAMELEFAIPDNASQEAYPVSLTAPEPAETAPAHSALRTPHSAFLLDWSPLIDSILADVKCAVPVGEISAKFHNTLVEAILAVARRLGQEPVVLSGGCFQNRYLTEHAVQRLQAEGFRPYWHQRVPPNDGGIALGQLVEALRQERALKSR
jgi:hydrogenase maturation protein HypF